MDFSLSPDEQALRDLARQILADACTNEHLGEVAATEAATDLALWRTLGAAGLIGIGLPESAGGGGLGWLGAAIVLEEVGRSAAPVPALAVMALAAPALAGAGALPEGVLDGRTVVSAAIHEPLGDAWSPATAVGGGHLSGTKVCVPHGLLASRFVVTAANGLYAVDADAPGVTVQREDTTSGVPDALVTFDEAPATHIGGADAVAALLRRAQSAATLMVSGACQSALALTAAYAVSRQQFDKPIAAFQAVSQRAADAYIDTEGVRLTAWQAAWRLAEGKPCDEELLSAKFRAAEGGWRVTHAAQHIHGGVGVDRDYPLHRFFFLHKQLELFVGSATPTLQRLGKMLADNPA